MLVVYSRRQIIMQNLSGTEKKVTDHNLDKYITISESSKLAIENFTERLAKANLDRQRQRQILTLN